MTEKIVVTKKRKKRTLNPPRGVGAKKSRNAYPPADKLKAVRLRLEEGFSTKDVCAELGMATSCLNRWVQLYREFGEGGLQPAPQPSGKNKLPEAVHNQIVELRQQHPHFGIKRISQWLRRRFFMPASPETVRRRLHKANLMPKQKAKKKRNITRPRFFERATPNQMWQSDIFTFRLGGRYAYLIAFMDDYSRFIVGADLFRSPTAQAVIEVYRIAAGEFRPPKEMLTDNGRQYTSWRGTSRFEAELKKDRVAHFKSRPQHPMTLGKIERFWSTLWQDFLVRAQFESFESARERIRFWIKYYNHKRPHQGIEGLCPADRFFEIQSALRKTIEAGIQDNLLELALRGKPQAPFYMVGRMDGQSVVLRAEKGKLKLSVSDEQQNNEQELVYDPNKTPEPEQTAEERQEDPAPVDQRDGQGPGRAGGVDRTVQAHRCLPPIPGQLDDLPSLAAPGLGGDASSLGEPGQPGQGPGPEPAVAEPAAAPAAQPPAEPADQPPGPTLAEQGCQPPTGSGKTSLNEPQSPTTGGADLPGPLGPDDRQPGGPDVGHLPPSLLPVGTARPPGHDECPGGSALGTAQAPGRCGEEQTQRSDPAAGTTTPAAPTEGGTATDLEPVERPAGSAPQ